MLKIFHITDIHLSEKFENYILKKKEEFFKSVIAEARDSTFIVFCISGDIANFGNQFEYVELALPFFAELKERLEKEINDLKCDFLFIPGNHDCDFSDRDAMELRQDVIKILSRHPERVNNPSFVKNIITQKYFHEFKQLFHDEWHKCEIVDSNDLISKVKLNIDGKSIIFNLFNSSWISTIHEKPGEMYFPPQYIKSLDRFLGDINISIIHHPSHWLEPNNKREIENLLQEFSDIILSGHEHVPTSITLTDWNRREVHYIEGSALQEIGNEHISGYNLISIDWENEKIQIKPVNWNSTYYQSNNEGIWKPLFKDLSAKSNDLSVLSINRTFETFLSDIAIPISHPRKSNLSLSDIYIYPNVDEVIYQGESEILMSPEDILDLLNNEKEAHLLFTGDKDSGKTALAKMLFQYFYNGNYFPLYINASVVTPSTSRNINLLIRKNINSVYCEELIDLYLQLPRTERVLLIDDWHGSKLNSQTKSKFLIEANKYFKQVIFFSEFNDTVMNTIDMSSKEGVYKFRHFKLMDLGHVKRDEFIEKWVSLGQEELLESHNIIREIDRIKRILQPVLMQSFVPKYPLYLLIILNTIESGTPHNLDKSSNGYYFEILIKDSLASIEIENNETDKIYQYLTDLAFEMLLKSNRRLTLQEWRTFHRSHLEYYDMNEDQIVFNEIKLKFEKEKVIRNIQSCYEFYYPYVFYFFIAQYFARNINKIEVKEKISVLCKNLHVIENANIIMFLTHLSKDDFIKDEVLKAAQDIFKGITPLKLEEDVSIINNLSDELSPFVLEDVNVREHRKKVNQQLDDLERTNEKNKSVEAVFEQLAIADGIDEDESSDLAQVMEQIDMANKGFKMLDIIGQILRNYYGSMSGIDKQQLCEEHFHLGLRISHSLITDLSNQNENLIHYISSIIVDKGLENPARAEKVAKRLLYSMGGFITFNTLGKIGMSIGTPDLDRTFIKVQDSLPYNSVELVNLFIKIEFYDQFPYHELASFYEKNKGNKIAVQIAQSMVQRYLYMKETSRSDKQKICDTVGIKISPRDILKLQKRK